MVSLVESYGCNVGRLTMILVYEHCGYHFSCYNIQIWTAVECNGAI